MTLYTLNGSAPAPIPFRIVMPDGFTRTDPASFTPDEIAAAGYVEGPEPPSYDPETEQAPVWADGAWSVTALPPRAVPEAVTRAQAKIALLNAGLYEQVVEIIAQAPLDAQIWWSEADTFRRDNQWVGAIGGMLTAPLTSEQTDELFLNAEDVVA